MAFSFLFKISFIKVEDSIAGPYNRIDKSVNNSKKRINTICERMELMFF